MVNNRLQAFASPTPGVARYLQAPETFEGVVSKVDVVERGTFGLDSRYFLNFMLDPVGVNLSSPRNLALLVIHDEVRYEPLPNESAVDFLARVHLNQEAHANQVEREKPVRVSYTFSSHNAGLWKANAEMVTAIYRGAFGDAFADELAARLQGSYEPEQGAHPFTFDKDIDGEYTAPVMRMLNELRGLRFIVNAEEMKTKNRPDRVFTRYTWTRSRD